MSTKKTSSPREICKECGEPAVLFVTDNYWSWPIVREVDIAQVEMMMGRALEDMPSCLYCRTHGIYKKDNK